MRAELGIAIAAMMLSGFRLTTNTSSRPLLL